MQKTIWATMVAAAALSFGSEARAQANLHSGDVLRPGENMIYGELGWPDLAFGWQHGVSNAVDIGIRAGLIYGWEFTTFTGLGLGVRVPIRITPLKTQKVSVQIQLQPGLKFDNFGGGNALVCVRFNNQGQCTQTVSAGGYYDYFGDGGTHFGLWLYTALEVGIHINRDATISPGIDLPIFINFTNGSYGAVPILIGAAFQYNLTDNMSLGGTLKLGPSILAIGDYNGCGGAVAGVVVSCGPPSPLGLIANGFFAYRL